MHDKVADTNATSAMPRMTNSIEAANLSRRSLITSLGAIGAAFALLAPSIAPAQTDPLPSSLGLVVKGSPRDAHTICCRL
jgi:secreted PhoX family phosphatase